MKLKTLAAALILAAPAFASAAPAYTLYAGGNLTLGQQTAVAGNVGAAGNVALNNQAQVAGNVAAGGNVEIGQQGAVAGNVAASGTIKLNNNAVVSGNVDSGKSGPGQTIQLGQNSIVTGNATHKTNTTVKLDNNAKLLGANIVGTPAAPDLMTVPAASVFAAGATDISTSQNAVKTLASGKYDDLSLGQGTTLKLSAGNYYFDSLTANQDTKFVFDLAGGAINLFFSGNVSLGQNFDVEYLNGTYDKIFTETKGSWTMNQNGEWFGTLLASGTNSFLKFGQGTDLYGNFWSRGNLTLDMGSTVSGMPTFDQPDEQPNPGNEVPAPASLLLMAIGLLALAGFRRKQA